MGQMYTHFRELYDRDQGELKKLRWYVRCVVV